MLNWLKNKKPPGKGQADKLEKSTADSFHTKPNYNFHGGLSQKDFEKMRGSEFEQIGIPFAVVISVETKNARRFDPRKISQETEAANAQLPKLGFNFRITCLDYFEAQLLLMDYNRLREKDPKMPEHSLVDVLVLREVERLIRHKHNLTENPTSGPEALTFQTEVKALLTKMWLDSNEYRLQQEAVRRLKEDRKKKNQPGPPLEAEVKAMMKKLRIRTTAANSPV